MIYHLLYAGPGKLLDIYARRRCCCWWNVSSFLCSLDTEGFSFVGLAQKQRFCFAVRMNNAEDIGFSKW